MLNLNEFTIRASQVVRVVKNLAANAGNKRDVGSIPGLGRSPGGGNSNPSQCSCLGNPVDRRVWWATVHGAISESENVSHSVMFNSLWPHRLALQAPLSMEFSRQECWSGLSFPPPGDVPGPGIEPRSPTLQARLFNIWAIREDLWSRNSQIQLSNWAHGTHTHKDTHTVIVN